MVMFAAGEEIEIVKTQIIDADGHVLEPPDMWENYLEAKYKDRAIRWKINDEGMDYLEIDGKPSVNAPSGINAGLAGLTGVA